MIQQKQIKNATGVNTSDFAKKTDWANLKSEEDKLDIDKLENVKSGLGSLKRKSNKLSIGKLETTPADLSKTKECGKKWCW